jgi:uncharacterized protein with PIN domain
MARQGSVPRFICDEQLGRLAKWLRIQGYDTLYECPIKDSKLIQLAQSERRILLTRDRDLETKTLWDAVVWIEATDYKKQLRELHRKVSIPRRSLFSRCLRCNEVIRPVSRAEVESRIPPEVYRTYREFFGCSACQKIFWRGSHVKNTQEKLRRILK